MKSFVEFLLERTSGLKQLPWQGNPQIGWHGEGSHLTMYHGTHIKNVQSISKTGLRAPSKGPTAGHVSLAFDPHTAHGYAAMGGESGFRAAGAKAQSVPHHERAVIVHKIPRAWAEKHMDPHMRGNINRTKELLTDRSKYEAHRAAGRPDHEYYATTELRFTKPIPPKFQVGYMRKVDTSAGG